MTFRKILKIWDAVEIYSSGTLATLALGSAFYQVVMRYVFNDAPEWPEESVLYLIIWSVLIISSKLTRDDQMIGADFVVNRLPRNIKRAVTIGVAVLSMTFCILVIVYGIEIVATALEMNERSTTRLRFPMCIAYLAIPSGAGLITLSLLYRLYSLVFHPEMIEHGHTEN
jgi:TRAP-type C4-dicarboxylate transport system permease small subunit